MLTVGNAFAHLVTVVEAVTVTVETVVVTGAAVTVVLTTIVGPEATTVEVVVTVVVEAMMERQEQAADILDEAKPARQVGTGLLLSRSTRFGVMARLAGAEVML